MTDQKPVPQDVIDIYHDYTHGAYDRRTFMSRLALSVGGIAAAEAMLPLLTNNYALAQTVAENDPRLVTETISYKNGNEDVSGTLVRLTGAVKRPALIVIHENRGLNPHIKDVARRYALEGFLALAVDILSPEGGTPANEDTARDMIGKLDGDLATARIAAAIPVLTAHPESTGSIGAVGYCWGGGQVNALAVTVPDLKAGVAYYGRQQPADKVATIKAALLLHYAEKDDRVNEGIAAYKDALTSAGKTFEIHTYPGTQHAFNNDTNAARYNAEAAKLAYERSLVFLRNHVGETPKAG
jgi:carboxymethylenebutenolidase